MKNTGVFINEAFSKTEGYKVKMRYSKLYINGVAHTIDDYDKLEQLKRERKKMFIVLRNMLNVEM